MIPQLLLTLALVCDKTAVSAFLLREPDYVNVLVFGDSWAAMSPSWSMLVDMFARHGVAAKVKSISESGTRACQWSQYPNNLADAARDMFPTRGADFVWYTLGGNDLQDSEYQACLHRAAFSHKDTIACMRQATKKINWCTHTLLSKLWNRYPRTKVLQCGYEIRCEAYECQKRSQFRTYCAYNTTCRHEMFLQWQSMLFHPENSEPPYQADSRFTGINILGAVQKVGKVIGADVGRPAIHEGTPCNLMIECIHPAKGTPGAWMVGETFWDLYFRKRVKSNVAPRFPPIAVANQTVQIDTEERDTMCMWDWVPNLANWTPPPKCRNDAGAFGGINGGITPPLGEEVELR